MCFNLELKVLNVLKRGLNFFLKTLRLFFILCGSVVPGCTTGVTLVFR